MLSENNWFSDITDNHRFELWTECYFVEVLCWCGGGLVFQTEISDPVRRWGICLYRKIDHTIGGRSVLWHILDRVYVPRGQCIVFLTTRSVFDRYVIVPRLYVELICSVDIRRCRSGCVIRSPNCSDQCS